MGALPVTCGCQFQLHEGKGEAPSEPILAHVSTAAQTWDTRVLWVIWGPLSEPLQE